MRDNIQQPSSRPLSLNMILRSLAPLLLLCAAASPRIESVIPVSTQPHATNPAVIFYDDFATVDPAKWPYLEPRPDSPHAKVSDKEGLGGIPGAMECFYAKGSQGIGNRKIVFGDSPVGRPLRRGEKFDDIYWRIYVKHQEGWTGNPDKMSRATAFASSRWSQAFILHVWSSGVPLTLDPATGVRDGAVVTTRYNDFPNLKWLGNSPKGAFPVHSPEEAGRWICVEAQLKLNTPGRKDGYAALWVDGKLDAERRNMDFRGTYTERTINAIFLEAYWNAGSPKDQYRWYDDFVVSTRPIGPITASATPTLLRRRSADASQWQAEIAADPSGTRTVWKSADLPSTADRVTTDQPLAAGPLYFCRIREKDTSGAWSAWSEWHQPFYSAPTATSASLR